MRTSNLLPSAVEIGDMWVSPLSMLQAVSQAGLVHFDLKCDNVFVQPLPGMSDEGFWSPVDDAPPFEVVLGDFGDSHDFSQAGCHPISL